jgi:hypothetical protein
MYEVWCDEAVGTGFAVLTLLFYIFWYLASLRL